MTKLEYRKISRSRPPSLWLDAREQLSPTAILPPSPAAKHCEETPRQFLTRLQIPYMDVLQSDSGEGSVCGNEAAGCMSSAIIVDYKFKGCSWGSRGFASGGNKVSQVCEVVVKQSNFTERELQTHL